MSTNYAYISTGNNALRLSKSKEDSPKKKDATNEKKRKSQDGQREEGGII